MTEEGLFGLCWKANEVRARKWVEAQWEKDKKLLGKKLGELELICGVCVCFCNSAMHSTLYVFFLCF